MNNSELIFIAKFTAKEGCRDVLHQHLISLIPIALQEEGCINYELTEELSFNEQKCETYDFCLIEKWRSRKYFDRHCNSNSIQNFFETALSHVLKWDVRIFRVVDES